MKNLFILIVFSSCNPIMTSMMGLKKPKTISDKEIVKYANRFNIPLADSYKMDTSFYVNLFTLDTAKYSNEIHDHYQPLQALYYTNNQLVSFQINCNTGGFPNLDWNGNGEFETFPPKQQNPLDSLFSLQQYLAYLKPLKAKTGSANIKTYQYVVFVHWNRFMNRQSKRLIKLVQENAQLKSSVKIIYINTDLFYASLPSED